MNTTANLSHPETIVSSRVDPYGNVKRCFGCPEPSTSNLNHLVISQARFLCVLTSRSSLRSPLTRRFHPCRLEGTLMPSLLQGAAFQYSPANRQVARRRRSLDAPTAVPPGAVPTRTTTQTVEETCGACVRRPLWANRGVPGARGPHPVPGAGLWRSSTRRGRGMVQKAGAAAWFLAVVQEARCLVGRCR